MYTFFFRGESVMTLTHAEGTMWRYVGLPLPESGSRDRSCMLCVTLTGAKHKPTDFDRILLSKKTD